MNYSVDFKSPAQVESIKVNENEAIQFKVEEDQASYSSEENEQLLEKERQRIAYELHDDTVQRMVAVRLRLEQFSYHVHKPELIEELSLLSEEMNEIIKSIRFMIWGVALPEFSNKTLSSLLRELFKKLEKILYLDVAFNCSNENLEFLMTPEVKKSIYRMVQEIAQNFVNHSMGFRLTIQIDWNERLKIVIQDNGQGFVRPRHNQELASLQKRATEIGALLTVTSPVGQGLFITIVLNNIIYNNPLR